MLAAGGQVGLQDVKHVARYFVANESQRGSVTWELWGGDSSLRWSQATLNKLGLTAAGDIEINLLSFYEGDADSRTFHAQKVSDDLKNDEVNALFRRTPEAGYQVWFNGDWADTEKDTVLTDRLIELDDDTAVYVAGALWDAPDSSVSLRDYEPELWDMAAAALDGIDWGMVDRTMKKSSLIAAPLAPNTTPGQYTKDERSKNATGQLRDATGRFAKVGDTGQIKNSTVRGRIAKVDAEHNQLYVVGDDGQTYQISPGDFTGDGGKAPGEPPPYPGAVSQPNQGPKSRPLNLDHILAQPRATENTPKGMLKHLLPQMGPGALKKVINDYGKFIEQERLHNKHKFKGGTGWNEGGGHKHKNLNADAGLAQGEDVPPTEKLTPETTDVKPLYLAIVARDDPQAVMDLVALIPATSTSSETTAFRRVGGSWVEDAKVLQDMRSPTPPPVVQLDDATYQDVLAQVDNFNAETAAEGDNPPEQPQPSAPGQPAPTQPAPVAASVYVDSEPEVIPMWGPNQQMLMLIAAAEGGLDRNKGNAERLRRYWLYGPGALKIMWNTPGDWTRCYRLLSKYMGVRAKGYCALRHKEATGHWTGDREHRQEFGISGEKLFSSTEVIKPRRSIIAGAIDDAKVRSLRGRVYGEYEGAPVDEPDAFDPNGGGRRFRIPLLLPEGLESGDGRTFDIGSIGIRNLPLPLLWQTETGEGHDGSVLVGRIDRIERIPGGLGNATGVFDTGPWGQEAQRLVDSKMLRWVSVDLDRFAAKQLKKIAEGETELADEPDDDGVIESPKMRIKKGRVMGATLVSKPAFQEVTIELEPLGDMVKVDDGMYTDDPQPMVASVGIAEKIPVEPPSTWFNRPVLNGPTPITVTDEGQVFGHIATWDVSHIGLPGSTRAPRSASNYAYFHTGVLRCSDGDDVKVGQLTLAGGHADIMADAYSAVKHYDDTGSAICDVHAGEDAYGIWVAGALRPGTTAEQVRALRASAPSGDWRNINGRLELVAVCQVNVPGFPVVRSQLTAGAVVSLVAAGAQTLARMQHAPEEELSSRMRELEQWEQDRARSRAEAAISKVRELHPKKDLDSIAASARSRVYNVLDVDGYLSEFKDFSPAKRDDLASKGHALKDGSFPIENTADLRRAVKAYGRASDDKKARVRRHIVKRARALGKPDMVPKDWTEAGITDDALRARDAREVLTAAALERRAEQIKKRVQ
jgi:hypothetical protein